MWQDRDVKEHNNSPSVFSVALGLLVWYHMVPASRTFPACTPQRQHTSHCGGDLCSHRLQVNKQTNCFFLSCITVVFCVFVCVFRWYGESWAMRQDQSRPSDSISLGTSSKARCSLATRGRNGGGSITYLHSPELT